MILTEVWALPIHIIFKISCFFFVVVDIILILFCLLFLSFIAKGLAMCRLGGVITTKIVLFYTLINTCFEQFLCINQPN